MQILLLSVDAMYPFKLLVLMVDSKVDNFFKSRILLIPELLKIVEQYVSSLVLVHCYI